MSDEQPKHHEAWDRRWQYVVLSADSAAGVVVGAGTLVSTLEFHKLRQLHVFDLTAGISVAILAVVVAAFAILAAFLTDEYTLFLKEALGDARRAFEPYAVVAVVSGMAAFVSVGGIFMWPVAPGWMKSVALAVALGLSTWAIAGTVQLVGITATHGRHRLRVPEIRAAYFEARKAQRAREQ